MFTQKSGTQNTVLRTRSNRGTCFHDCDDETQLVRYIIITTWTVESSDLLETVKSLRNVFL